MCWPEESGEGDVLPRVEERLIVVGRLHPIEERVALSAQHLLLGV